jgi:hypothetical protein
LSFEPLWAYFSANGAMQRGFLPWLELQKNKNASK